ncbi:hypothetical protein NQ318_004766 [Aromia moschata]|uniref:Peptidase C1A papain C-terminal domain-containing protein n=1 Tax=Aromia moschata TaxID=1265417 RepID=A0AAV8XYH7_9CUCU|nr:hypothetical protein NQ318_004766 [Aromia moschata]
MSLLLVGTVGPVGISIFVDDMISSSGGVYDDPDCPNIEELLNHQVLLVGYGYQDGNVYWLIKNSWGIQWGES